ncbi:MAG: hypothetical protein RJB03_1752 [Bacteroidota bacterium]|jgi:hypothetical protein
MLKKSRTKYGTFFVPFDGLSSNDLIEAFIFILNQYNISDLEYCFH